MSGRNEELLSAYFDGELSDDEKSLVEQLLEEDVAAREALDDVSEVSGWVRSLPRPAAPVELRDAVLARVRTAATPVGALAPEKRPAWRRHARWAATSAAGLLLAVVVYQTWPVPDAPRLATSLDRARDGRLPDALHSRESELLGFAAPEEATRTASIAGDPASLARQNSGQMLADLETALEGGAAPVAGEVVQDLSQVGDQVVVIHYHVVDTQDLPGRVQMVLTQNGIRAFDESEQIKSLDFDTHQNGRFDAIYLDAPMTNFNSAVEQINGLDFVTSVTTNTVSFSEQESGGEVPSDAPENARAAQLSRFRITGEEKLAEHVAPDTDGEMPLPASAPERSGAPASASPPAAPAVTEFASPNQSVAPFQLGAPTEPLQESLFDESAPVAQQESGAANVADAYQVPVPVRQEFWDKLQEHEHRFAEPVSGEGRRSQSKSDKLLRRNYWNDTAPRGVQGPPSPHDRVRAVILLVPLESE